MFRKDLVQWIGEHVLHTSISDKAAQEIIITFYLISISFSAYSIITALSQYQDIRKRRERLLA